LKIVMVSGHGCIRVHKMALPLIYKGHDVHLIAGKVPSFWPNYKTFSLCSDIDQYQEAIKLHKDADIFHCHNEPSWFVTAVKEISDKPVIMDVHDSYLARSTPEEATEKLNNGEPSVRVLVEERTNFQLADALNFPGESFADIVRSEFKLEQPHLVLPSYVPSMFYQYNMRDWHGGLVYEGKMNLPSETKKNHLGFEYCDYTDLANKCKEIGMDFHVYSGRNDEKFKEHFKDCFVHKPLDYDELLKSVARHDWGLVGNTIKTREWELAAPNKLFEYLACGVPVVAMNAPWCENFLKETGMGISVSGPEELAEKWSLQRECRTQVMKHRKDWAMENHIHKLEDFYRALS
jgi:hypothetical protein